MDKSDRDLMNVDSFSQLPFLRPTPPPPPLKEKPSRAIRLFGQKFGNCIQEEPNSTENNKNPEIISSRKFECHYCCRNFPTSQALGGHQNAHKRERQQAKRAHLQSDVYGLMGYKTHSPWSPNGLYCGGTSLGNGYGYGSYNAYSTPPPQLGLWRIPVAAQKIPLFGDDPNVSLPSIKDISPAPQIYESKPVMQDHVSLDLHL